jgi:hypothetical protein
MSDIFRGEFTLEGDDGEFSKENEEEVRAPKPFRFTENYGSVCRRMGTKPLNKVKVSEAERSLSLQADHLKVKDWWPLLQALANDRSLAQFAVRCIHSVNKCLYTFINLINLDKVKHCG